MAGGWNGRGVSSGRDPWAGATWRILNFILIAMSTSKKKKNDCDQMRGSGKEEEAKLLAGANG